MSQSDVGRMPSIGEVQALVREALNSRSTFVQISVAPLPPGWSNGVTDFSVYVPYPGSLMGLTPNDDGKGRELERRIETLTWSEFDPREFVKFSDAQVKQSLPTHCKVFVWMVPQEEGIRRVAQVISDVFGYSTYLKIDLELLDGCITGFSAASFRCGVAYPVNTRDILSPGFAAVTERTRFEVAFWG